MTYDNETRQTIDAMYDEIIRFHKAGEHDKAELIQRSLDAFLMSLRE